MHWILDLIFIIGYLISIMINYLWNDAIMIDFKELRMEITSIRYKLNQLGFTLNFDINCRNWVSCLNCNKLDINCATMIEFIQLSMKIISIK